MNHCRLCGHEKDRLTPIFQGHLVEDVQRYLQIQISEYDPLPQKICGACEDEVHRIVRYIVNCQKAQIDFHKQIYFAKMKISDEGIKLEDVTSDFKNQKEFDCFEECEDKENALFICSVPQLQISDGKPISSVVEVDHDQLKQLEGEEKYFDQILEKSHLQPTFPEVQNDFISPQKSSENMDHSPSMESSTDIKNEGLSYQLKVPTILLTPIQGTVSRSINQVSSRPDASTLFNVSTKSGSTILVCSKCPFKTERKFRLNQHYSEVHEKRFSCEHCGRRFGKKSKLLLHVEADHTDLPPVVCSLCTKSFTQKYDYKEHLKTHSNEGHLWFCDHCGNNFSHQHKLDVHLAKFHKSKSVKCSQCPYVAAHKYQMKQHTREVHQKSIICHHCGKRESKKCRMAAHIQKKHMPKTEFVCQVCTARYSSNAWFLRHQREGCP